MPACSMKNEVRDEAVSQLRTLVSLVDKITEHVEENNLLDGDDNGELGALLFDLRTGATYASNIAHNLSLTPGPNIFAQRIYDLIKNWVTAEFCGKDLRDSGPFMTPGYVYGYILAILEDDYAHLNIVQREAIINMTARIVAAGDGINTSDYAEVRASIIRDSWTIRQMLDACQLDDYFGRLDFDPETGKAWK